MVVAKGLRPTQMLHELEGIREWFKSLVPPIF